MSVRKIADRVRKEIEYWNSRIDYRVNDHKIEITGDDVKKAVETIERKALEEIEKGNVKQAIELTDVLVEDLNQTGKRNPKKMSMSKDSGGWNTYRFALENAEIQPEEVYEALYNSIFGAIVKEIEVMDQKILELKHPREIEKELKEVYNTGSGTVPMYGQRCEEIKKGYRKANYYAKFVLKMEGHEEQKHSLNVSSEELDATRKVKNACEERLDILGDKQKQGSLIWALQKMRDPGDLEKRTEIASERYEELKNLIESEEAKIRSIDSELHS